MKKCFMQMKKYKNGREYLKILILKQSQSTGWKSF